MKSRRSLRAPVVLIVEPDPALAQLLHAVLLDDGCQSIVCETQGDPWRIIRRDHPALSIIGLRLATSKGVWTLLNQLRADPTTAALPILFVTADERLALEQRPLLQTEGYALLETPFGVDVLLEVVRGQLRAGRRTPPLDTAERNPPH